MCNKKANFSCLSSAERGVTPLVTLSSQMFTSRVRQREVDNGRPIMAALGHLTGRAIGLSLLAALLIVGALLWYLFSNNDLDLSERKIIYVTGSVVNVREGPSTGFPVVTKLKKGHKLVELSRDGDWVNITLEGTMNAWIHASLVSAEPQAEKSP